jgi:hypothetical protein
MSLLKADSTCGASVNFNAESTIFDYFVRFRNISIATRTFSQVSLPSR